MARVSPAAPEQFAQVADIMERWKRTKGYPPNSWLTMVRRPGVFRAYRALHTAVMMEYHARDPDRGQRARVRAETPRALGLDTRRAHQYPSALARKD